MNVAGAGSTQETAAGLSTGRAIYALCVLLLLYCLAFVDRQILAVLVVPIQRDIGIGDTGFSLLLGLAFTLLYTTVGLPIARIADRTNRRNIALSGSIIWSLGTTVSGLARSFVQLFLARVLVGIGEACLNPSVIPLLSDAFPARHRGKALGIYMLGIPLGAGLANLVGGALLPKLNSQVTYMLPLLGAVRPWQVILFILGASGLVGAVLLAGVREPARRHRVSGAPSARDFSVHDIARFLAANWVVFTAIACALCASAFMTFGVNYWIPAFFQRSYGLDAASAGAYLSEWGGVTLICGAVGVLGGGVLCDFLAVRSATGYLRTLIIGVILLAVGFGTFAMAPSPQTAVMLLVPGAIGSGLLQASGITTLMAIVPDRMRGQVSALYFLIVNLVGATLGPTVIALLTDDVFGAPSQLRYAIALTSIAVTALSLALLLSSRRDFPRLVS